MTALDLRPPVPWWTEVTGAYDPDDVGWAHPGTAYHDGTFYTTEPRRATIVRFGPDGLRCGSLTVDAHDVHGISPGADGSLWLADPGTKAVRGSDGAYRTTSSPTGGHVLHVDGGGALLGRISAPRLPVYERRPFRPTSIAISGGDVWVADGYGADLVHRFDVHGELLGTVQMDGVRFDTPHSLTIDRRGPCRLLVADRGNRRILALDPSTARLVAVIAQGHLVSPSAMTTWQEFLVVADLCGRLTVFDGQDRFVRHVGGTAPLAHERSGWPNELRDSKPVSPKVPPGTFIAPHDLAVSPDGLLAVSEWVVGGRVSLLDLSVLLHPRE